MNDNTGYLPKDLKFGEEGRKKLIAGINKMSSAVKSTLGPNGNTVLIESPNHTHGITVTKDGVTVAKEIFLIDPIENLAVKMMKEAADRTSSMAGDGTTTAIVLTEALVMSGMKRITPEMNRSMVLRELSNYTDIVVDALKQQSKKLTNSMLLDVATISANNDKEVGKIIADVYKKIGRNGIITVENSQHSETYSETTTGMRINRGYLSNMFINDQRKDECVFDDVFVLVCDIEISNYMQIETILKWVISNNKKLLIIAPCSTSMINTLALNVKKNGLKFCAITPPSFGYKQHELMQDIAVSVGATYFSEKTGDDLSLIDPEDLGHASKIIVGKEKTILIKSDIRMQPDEVKKRVAEIKDVYSRATTRTTKNYLQERISSLQGGIGVIYVGGNTDLEQKELYDRVDDAVCAVRSALEEGILPGAGKALYEIAESELLDIELCVGTESEEKIAAANILRDALVMPLFQILSNAGLKVENFYPNPSIPGTGYNLKTGVTGDLLAMGVIDPLKVTRSALQNAVSVATTILSTNAIVTMARIYEPNN